MPTRTKARPAKVSNHGDLAPIGKNTGWVFGKPDPEWEWIGEGSRCKANWPPNGRMSTVQCELRSHPPRVLHSALLSSL